MNYTPADLLVLREPMLLLDEILVCDETGLKAAVDVDPQKLFCDAHGAPGWVAIEWMAQAAGAWLGARQRLHDKPVDIGFLLGTRHYQGPARFRPGRMHIEALDCMHDPASGLAVIDTAVREAMSDTLLASARLKFAQPADMERFFKDQSI